MNQPPHALVFPTKGHGVAVAVRVRMLRWAVVLVLAPMISCADSADWCDLSGHWSGAWTSQTAASGSLDTQLDVHGSDVSGTMTFAGSPCFDAAQLAGVLANKQVSGSATAGAMHVDVTASWVEDHLEGTYDAVSAGACTGDGGTFKLEKL